MALRPALIIDLDGTLLQTNTFRDYLIFCGRCALHFFRWDISFLIFFWVMFRKLRLITHSTMKRHLMQRTVLFMQRKSRMDDFVEEELLLVNQRVKAEVERFRNRGHLLVLATAAPSFYAKAIADDLRLDACLATLLPSEVVIGEWHENVGETKVQSLQHFLQQHEAHIAAIITDHQDDIPLLRFHSAGPNLLVSPSSDFLRMAEKENICFETID